MGCCSQVAASSALSGALTGLTGLAHSLSANAASQRLVAGAPIPGITRSPVYSRAGQAACA